MKKLQVFLFIFFVVIGNLYSQNKTLKGKVISEYLEPMPRVSIIINDSIEVGSTDLNGLFEIDIPVSIKKLVFRSLALEPAIIESIDTCNTIEVIMLLAGNYDVSLRKADRLRKKQFRELPKLHKQAFEKNIFKTEKACYSQMFVEWYHPKANDNIVSVINHQQRYGDFIFYTALNKQHDTVMLIAPVKKVEACNLDKAEINLNNIKKIESLKVCGNTIYFQCKVSDVNDNYTIMTGNGKPGDDKRYIYSYSTYPYFINSCDVLKR